MLCAPLKSDRVEAIEEANQQADLIELRLDLFQPHDLRRLRAQCKKPVIFKMRQIDMEALRLIPDYVDLPHDISCEEFEYVHQHFPKVQRICSYHNFEETPDVEVLYQQMSRTPAEIYKICCKAHSTIDALRMLKSVRKHRFVGICMGEKGEVTRILAPVFGAPWTYAFLSPGQTTAEGQLSIDELIQVYRYPSLSSKTGLYGLIGDPVSHTIGHLKHNAAFHTHDLDAVYVKMCIQQDELNQAFSLLRELGFKGLSVTMPLKRAIAPLLDIAESASINTVSFDDKTYGWNTDGSGALDLIEKNEKVFHKTLVLLGAGGAAEGIALEAKKRGAHLIILNRTLASAQLLGEKMQASVGLLSDFPKIAKQGYDVLINCTSVGMQNPNDTPIASTSILPHKVVMDLIISSEETAFLKAAKKKKCLVFNGEEMWSEQAQGQYRYWFKKRFD